MKPSLILLPGMMCDARLFKPQISALSTTHNVTVLPLINRESVTELAQDVLDQAPPTFALLGLSMGGIVAMEIIHQAPARVTHLALFDTNPLADTPERVVQRDKEIQRVQAGELRAVMRDDMKPNYLAEGPNKQAILDLCMAMAESLGPDAFIQQTRALKSRQDQCSRLKKVTVPTLIACGEEDSLCPQEKHQLMHQLVSGSVLSIIPGAGHLPTLEQPALTNQKISTWLAA